MKCFEFEQKFSALLFNVVKLSVEGFNLALVLLSFDSLVMFVELLQLLLLISHLITFPRDLLSKFVKFSLELSDMVTLLFN